MDDSQVSIGTGELVITTPSSSFASHNFLEITQSIGENEIKEPNSFTNFLEIKQKNEGLKEMFMHSFGSRILLHNTGC